MTYTEDRATFEAQMFQPPFLARMLERSARYIDGLRGKDEFLAGALERFWELRDEIKQSSDVLECWELALRYSAKQRKYWLVWPVGAVEGAWIRGINLGRR